MLPTAELPGLWAQNFEYLARLCLALNPDVTVKVVGRHGEDT